VDIWIYRIVTAVYTVLLVGSCLCGGKIQWTFTSEYVKLFVCLLAALATNFAWLIPTKEKEE